MQHVGRGVKHAADAVADEVLDQAELVLGGDGGDRGADLLERHAGAAQL